MFALLKRRRRARLRRLPVPGAWRDIVARRAPAVSRLPEPDRRELFGHVHVLLAEKRFTGCGGLAMTDEIRVTIAAQAALLLLHRETDYFPGLRSILVYPESYVAPLSEEQDDGTVIEGSEAREGESWHEGSLVLSWSDVIGGAADPHDGYNLVLHEFAHQLDAETGQENGTPRLASKAQYKEWQGVMSREYEALCEAVRAGRPTVLDAYGAESPAEFFAVSTEAFFERPRNLKARHPELYEQLKLYYRQDPERRAGAEPGACG